MRLHRRLRFLAKIYRIWMMRHVDVPDDVARELLKQMRGTRYAGAGAKRFPTAKASKEKPPKFIPVIAIVSGKSSRVSLIPAGGGRYRVQINTAQRKAAGADVGEVIGVELLLDRESRELPVPADLLAALRERPRHGRAFVTLTTGQRRQFIKWFDSAKSAEAREKRLMRALEVLLERALLTRKPRQAKRQF